MLLGNLYTSQTLSSLSASTDGWTVVTLDFAEAMADELDTLAHEVSDRLTNATKAVIDVQSLISDFLGTVNSGAVLIQDRGADQTQVLSVEEFDNDIHAVSFLTWNLKYEKGVRTAMDGSSPVMSPADETAFLQTSMSSFGTRKHKMSSSGARYAGLSPAVVSQVVSIQEAVLDFMDMLKPALTQIGEWLVSFGPKVESSLEQFSVTLDKVQKLFDSLMSKMATPTGLDEMVHNTFTLFDVSNTGSITASDVQSVSVLYGIPALQEPKGAQLHSRYDANGDGGLDPEEFERFSQAPELPNALSLVLRQYSRRLSEIAGNVASARMRDEVAAKVVDYLQLVCAKNMTKVGWVADRLGNRSLPLAFTADVLTQLAIDLDNPDSLTIVDVGAVVVNAMMDLHPDTVGDAVDLLSDPEYWGDTGLEIRDQPVIVERVSTWVSKAADSHPDAVAMLSKSLGSAFPAISFKALVNDSGNGTDAPDVSAFLQGVPAMLHESVKERSAIFFGKRNQLRARQRSAATASLSLACRQLVGPRCPQASVPKSVEDDPDVARVTKGGVPAQPETLEFARFLSYNATSTSQTFQQLCFDYSSQSSNQLDSFADKIKGMVRSLQGFLDLMEKYATPRGMEQLEAQVQEFLDNAAEDVRAVGQTAANTTADAAVTTAISGTWDTLVKLLTELQSTLPTVIGFVKDARQYVTQVSSPMQSVFGTFNEKAPPIFTQAAGLYKMVWIMYFVLFAVINLMLLIFAFWAYGWFEGLCTGAGENEQRPDNEPQQEPQGFLGRCWANCDACCTACSAWTRGNGIPLDFWSLVMLAEIIVLLMFLVSILFAMLSAIKIVISSGCAQLYILKEGDVCTQSLRLLQEFVKTFWARGGKIIEDACDTQSLLTCQMISKSLMLSGILTAAGSLLATVITVQLIIEAGRLHGKARMRK